MRRIQPTVQDNNTYQAIQMRFNPCEAETYHKSVAHMHAGACTHVHDTQAILSAPPYPCRIRHSTDRTRDVCRT